MENSSIAGMESIFMAPRLAQNRIGATRLSHRCGRTEWEVYRGSFQDDFGSDDIVVRRRSTGDAIGGADADASSHEDMIDQPL